VLLAAALTAVLLPATSALAEPRAPATPPESSRVATADGHARATALVRTRTARARRLTRVTAREPNPFATTPLFVDGNGPARQQAREWRDARPADAALMDDLASQPTALWLGDWTANVRGAVAQRAAAARATGSMALLVAYNIPDRDCGLHSSGGAQTAAAYREWIDDLAAGIRDAPAAVILEPDALGGLGCLSASARLQRMDLLEGAIARLGRQPNVAVYLDAGNPSWVSAPDMARRLRAAGVAGARGFALNVSSFHATAQVRAYGRAISRRIGGAPFVIDTSRNGAGPSPSGEWCNPPDRAIGERPTAATGDPLVDAHLWVKRPGESDGQCNGGPPAGTWWPDYALGLARRAAS